MTWTAQLTYTAGGLTSDDIDALTDALGDDLGDGGIVYGSDTGRLQITLDSRSHDDVVLNRSPIPQTFQKGRCVGGAAHGVHD